ncbi:hypothetical protein ACFVH4_18440 [Nocardia ignorata]|uniref:hypothetical protein n=2 Tax=Actinomycetes TaxID=1760 RepID=UPI0036438561
MSDDRSIDPADTEITALAKQVATARGKLPLQHDTALYDALSEAEIRAERELAEWIRAQRRKQRRRAVADELAADKRDRRTGALIRRTDEADARWHRRALAARRRVSSADARLAQLYRRAEWSSRALIGVVLLGMVWAGVNVQHNLVPSGDMSDPLYWLSFGIEAMISIPIIVIMIAATTAARWGRELERGKVIVFELALLGTTVALNAGPHLASGAWGRAAEFSIAPVMVGVVIWLHAWVSARYAMLIEGASVELPGSYSPAERMDTAVAQPNSLSTIGNDPRLSTVDTATLPTAQTAAAGAAMPVDSDRAEPAMVVGEDAVFDNRTEHGESTLPGDRDGDSARLGGDGSLRDGASLSHEARLDNNTPLDSEARLRKGTQLGSEPTLYADVPLDADATHDSEAQRGESPQADDDATSSDEVQHDGTAPHSDPTDTRTGSAVGAGNKIPVTAHRPGGRRASGEKHTAPGTLELIHRAAADHRRNGHADTNGATPSLRRIPVTAAAQPTPGEATGTDPVSEATAHAGTVARDHNGDTSAPTPVVAQHNSPAPADEPEQLTLATEPAEQLLLEPEPAQVTKPVASPTAVTEPVAPVTEVTEPIASATAVAKPTAPATPVTETVAPATPSTRKSESIARVEPSARTSEPAAPTETAAEDPEPTAPVALPTDTSDADEPLTAQEAAPEDDLLEDHPVDEFDYDDTEVRALARRIATHSPLRLTLEQIEEILELTDQSWSARSIGAEVGVPGKTVTNVVEFARKIRHPYAFTG